jgi:hypothetical protein
VGKEASTGFKPVCGQCADNSNDFGSWYVDPNATPFVNTEDCTSLAYTNLKLNLNLGGREDGVCRNSV